MKILSVRQYAESIEVTKPAVMKMIHENRLPYGVIAQKVDDFYIIIISN